MIKLLLAAVIIGITSITYADHKPTTEFDGLGWSQLPTICGTTEAVNEYLEHNKFILESVSVGKENANAEGSPVYIVTYYINEARDQSMSVITAPSGLESCMLYRSFDLSYPGMTL
tara:strand:- start:112 stop:459 length:348 start_codon:yes stop_codon:yes gene_type:complete